jgi:UDP-N-acetylmuramoyl-tripeptide--D-alanyl-D-alanine ligase
VMQATVREVAEWCGAVELVSDQDSRLLSGVSTDTRKIQPGQLFVPLSGERVDGHDYIHTAWEAGASASLWDKSRPIPDIDIPLIIVENMLEALQALSIGFLKRLQAKVVAVTGSNGKTTTKDLISSVLKTRYRVHKTEGNYNNHIGLPLTILGAPHDTEVLVLEMGMSGWGEISLLSGIGQPDIGVITNVGESHMLQLGSRRNIARAKLEITDGLKSGGVLVFNGDEPLLSEELALKELTKEFSLVTFGENLSNDWVAGEIRVTADETRFSVNSNSGEASFVLPVPGRHNAVNALAAIAVGRLLGLTFEEIGTGLCSVKLTGMRIERSSAKNGAVILNDAYNASPTSVKAAINLVAELTGYRRKWIVLGDMLELGPDEVGLHGAIGSYLNESKADHFVAYGPLSEHTYWKAKPSFADERVLHFEDKGAMTDYLLEHLDSKDLVLVKASRGMRLEDIVSVLQKGARG